MDYDSTGWERERFDGTFATLPASSHRPYRQPGHGPQCSSNPEVGCLCSASDDESGAPYAERGPDGRVL